MSDVNGGATNGAWTPMVCSADEKEKILKADKAPTITVYEKVTENEKNIVGENPVIITLERDNIDKDRE